MKGERKSKNGGFSLVELLCAVAILALVSGTIATIVTVSTRTYRSSVSETNVQQEAQLAANNIGNIIKDACTVIYYDGVNKVKYINGEAQEGTYEGNTVLSIVTNDHKQYDIQYLGDVKNSEGVVSSVNKLIYKESTISGSVGDIDTVTDNYQLLAGNISKFSADTEQFKDTRTVSLNLTVTDSSTGREIPMTYTMTSRNEAVDNLEYNPISDQPVIIFLEDTVCLVPGEDSYSIPIVVTGKYDGSLTSVTDEGLLAELTTTDYVTVSIPKVYNADGTFSYKDSYSLTVQTTQKDGEKPKASASTTIYCRYADKINVTYSANVSKAEGGTKEGKGAEYTFYANVTGGNLSKFAGRTWDVDYKRGQAVYWSLDLTVDSKHFTFESSSASTYENDYIKVTQISEDIDKPSMKVTLKQTMYDDFELTVTALSKHGQGINKANSAYDENKKVIGSATLKPRGTKINGTYEITLEPNEEGTVKLDGMVGAVMSNPKFVIDGKTDDNTKVTGYDSTTKEVKIKLGKNEKGKNNSYVLYIDVYLNASMETAVNKITVYVSRIDDIYVYVKDNFKTEQKLNDDGTIKEESTVMNIPTYDFRARYNVESVESSVDEMRANLTPIYTNRLAEYEKDTTSEERKDKLLKDISNAFATKISWELKDSSGNVMTYRSGGVTKKCEGTVITTAGITEQYQETVYENGKQKIKTKERTILAATGAETNIEVDNLYTIVSIKPARVVKLLDGTWTLKQVAEIDISPKAGTNTGLPEGSTLTVTMRALNPDKDKYNATELKYNDEGVEASASIKGDQKITCDVDYVIVERGQGLDALSWDGKGADSELKIPLTIEGGGAYSLSAEIVPGSSSSNKTVTRLAVYKDEDDKLIEVDDNGNNNPYMQSGSTRKWWLGLVIGEDEQGRYDPEGNKLYQSPGTGYVEVRVTAYNGAGNEIGTANIPLAIRAVDYMELKVVTDKQGDSWTTSDDLNEVNTSGALITLAAYPTGYGENGTEFYAMQTKSDGKTAYSWETTNHGEYKSPYNMKWTMTVNGVTKELTEWVKEGLYISSVTTQTYDTDKGASTITLKLRDGETLPGGTVIRATSLHSLGEDNGKYYNKSGKNYSGDSEGVYAELEITAGPTAIPIVGFERGHEMGLGGNWDYSEYSGPSGQKRAVFRYRKIDSNGNPIGDWVGYVKCKEEGIVKKINYDESLLFLPQYAYEIQFIPIIYSDDTTKLYYPYSTELAEGLGLTASWDSSKTITDLTPYTETYTIAPVTVENIYMSDGSNKSYSTPFKYTGEERYIYFTLTSFMADNISNSYFKMNIQKKNSDGTWTTVGTKTSRYENLEITKNAGTMYFKFDQNNVMANGDYRVQIVLDKSIFKDVFKQTSGDPLNWTSVASSEATDVVVGDYIYFNVNKQ